MKTYFNLFFLFTIAVQAQYADYSGMIRREARATQEHINRMNAYYNKPSGSTSVLYDYSSKNEEEKERLRREREQKDSEVRAFLKKQDELEEQRREKWRKHYEMEDAVFRATAHKAITFIFENGIPISNSERDDYIKFELMKNGAMLPDYEQKMTELLTLNEVNQTIHTADLDELLGKIMKLNALEGLNPNQMLEHVFQLQKRFPKEEEKIDNALFNLFVNFYSSRHGSRILFDNYDKFYELYQYLDQKYPETVLLLMKDLIKEHYHPIEHGNIIFKNNHPKASTKDWEKRHKKNDEKIKDIQFGFVGYAEKSKTLEGILELCGKYNVEPMQVVLLNDFEELNTKGNLIVTDYMYGSFDKNNPRFTFFKPLAALCDKNSTRAYMLYMDKLDYKDSGKLKILDYANSQLEKGCTTAFTLYFIDHFPSFKAGVDAALESFKRFKEKASAEQFNSVITEIFKGNSYFDPSGKTLEEKANVFEKRLVEEIKKLAE